MTDEQSHNHRELEWVGGVLEDLRDMPVHIKRSFGYSLGALQLGQAPVGDIRRLSGIDGVFEIRKSSGNAYRLVYCALFEGVIYVLHAFKKKSHEGSKVPRIEMALVHTRLQEAKRRHELRGQ